MTGRWNPLNVQHYWDYYGWDYHWIGEMPENGSDEWIEYIPPVVERPRCPGCGENERTSCWICR